MPSTRGQAEFWGLVPSGRGFALQESGKTEEEEGLGSESYRAA